MNTVHVPAMLSEVASLNLAMAFAEEVVQQIVDHPDSVTSLEFCTRWRVELNEEPPIAILPVMMRSARSLVDRISKAAGIDEGDAQ